MAFGKAGKASGLVVRLMMDTSNFDKNSTKAQTRMKGMQNALKGFTAAAAGVGLGLGGIAAGFAAITRTGSELQETIVRANALLGEKGTTGTMKELQAAAIKFGRTTEFTSNQAGQAMQEFAKQGLTAAEAIKATGAALAVATVGATDMASASDFVGTTLKQFSMDADQAGEVSDTLAVALTNTRADFTSLRSAMTYAGPAARAFGLDMDEAVAASAAFIEIGLDGTLAGNAFKMAMQKLQKPTVAAEKALKKVGLTVADITPGMMGADGEVTNFSDTIRKLSDSANITGKDIVEIFGARAGSPMTVLIEQTRQGVSTVDRLSGALAGKNGLAARMREDMLNNIAGTSTLIASATDGAMQSIFNTFGGVNGAFHTLLKEVLQFVEEVGVHIEKRAVEFEEAFGTAAGQLQQAFGESEGAAEGMVDALVTISKLIAGVSFALNMVGGYVDFILTGAVESEHVAGRILGFIGKWMNPIAWIWSALKAIYALATDFTNAISDAQFAISRTGSGGQTTLFNNAGLSGTLEEMEELVAKARAAGVEWRDIKNHIIDAEGNLVRFRKKAGDTRSSTEGYIDPSDPNSMGGPVKESAEDKRARMDAERTAAAARATAASEEEKRKSNATTAINQKFSKAKELHEAQVGWALEYAKSDLERLNIQHKGMSGLHDIEMNRVNELHQKGLITLNEKARLEQLLNIARETADTRAYNAMMKSYDDEQARIKQIRLDGIKKLEEAHEVRKKQDEELAEMRQNHADRLELERINGIEDAVKRESELRLHGLKKEMREKLKADKQTLSALSKSVADGNTSLKHYNQVAAQLKAATDLLQNTIDKTVAAQKDKTQKDIRQDKRDSSKAFGREAMANAKASTPTKDLINQAPAGFLNGLKQVGATMMAGIGAMLGPMTILMESGLMDLLNIFSIQKDAQRIAKEQGVSLEKAAKMAVQERVNKVRDFITGVVQALPIIIGEIVALIPILVSELAFALIEAAPKIVIQVVLGIGRLIKEWAQKIIDALAPLGRDAEFKDQKRELKEMLRKGEISRSQYKEMLGDAKQAHFERTGKGGFWQNAMNKSAEMMGVGTDTANTVTGLGGNQSSYSGISYVPKTLRGVTLHKGERVVPAHENKNSPDLASPSSNYGRSASASPVITNVMIDGVVVDGAIVTAHKDGKASGTKRMMSRVSNRKAGISTPKKR